MRIEKKDFLIRSAVPEDAAQLAAWWNDGKLMSSVGYPNGLGVTEAELAESLEKQAPGKEVCIIEVGGQPIGECSYEVHPDHASLGIKIAKKKFQNVGWGTKVLKDFLRFLFTDRTLRQIHPVDRVEVEVNPRNKRACHVFEKLGFLLVKTEKNAWTNQVGKLQSRNTYDLSWERYANFTK